MKEDNTLLWVALIGAAVFVLTKTKLVSSQSGPAAILPPAPAPSPGTPAAMPSTAAAASALVPPLAPPDMSSAWDSTEPTDFNILSAQ